MNTVVELEWTFSPPDYFEEILEICRDDYTMTIANGKAEAKVRAAIYDTTTLMHQTLHESLNDRFLGVQLLDHRPYKLSTPTITRMHDDGRKDISFEVEGGSLVLVGESVDIQIADKDGNIISDSRRDRIEKKKNLAELVASHRTSDSLLAAMLRSYKASVRDPSNEMVHLYEIWEALSDKFGGEKGVREVLSITAAQRSRFGYLCNDAPLRQGRHRGKMWETLRDASETELSESRGLARAMIEAYLQYVDRPV